MSIVICINGVKASMSDVKKLCNYVYVWSTRESVDRCKCGASVSRNSRRVLDLQSYSLFNDFRMDIFLVPYSCAFKWEAFIQASLCDYWIMGEVFSLDRSSMCHKVVSVLSGPLVVSMKYRFGRKYNITVNGQLRYVPPDGCFVYIGSSEAPDRCIIGVTHNPWNIWYSFKSNNMFVCTNMDFWCVDHHLGMNDVVEKLSVQFQSDVVYSKRNYVVIKKDRTVINLQLISEYKLRHVSDSYFNLEENSCDTGYIYILYSPEVPNMVKIGYSRVPNRYGSFVTVWSCMSMIRFKVNNARNWEKYIHAALGAFWLHNEIFSMDFKYAALMVDQLLKGKCQKALKLTGGSVNYIYVNGIRVFSFPGFQQKVEYVLVYHCNMGSRVYMDTTCCPRDHYIHFKCINFYRSAYFHYFTYTGNPTEIMDLAVKRCNGKWLDKHRVECDIQYLLDIVISIQIQI